MKFVPADLEGAFLVVAEPRGDERGFLARTYCDDEFRASGLHTRWPQCNLTRTERRGTIRGMHFQADPRPEIKLVRCTAGAVFDVIVDLRPGSRTFGRWQGFELHASRVEALYIPAGCAHGFQCLVDGSDLFYMMGDAYVPELARGVLFDDPEIGIAWPLPATVVSERDRAWPKLAAVVQR